jgi:hypothetical protein
MRKKRTPHMQIIIQVKIKLPFWLWELTALSSHRAQISLKISAIKRASEMSLVLDHPWLKFHTSGIATIT